MSVPFTFFICDSCDYSTDDLAVSGWYLYLIDGLEVPLNRKLAWCHNCAGLEAVESFDDEQEVRDELSRKLKAAEEMAEDGMAKRLVESLKYRSHSAGLARLIRGIRELCARLELIDRRRDDQRCLRCGSNQIERLRPRKLNGPSKKPPRWMSEEEPQEVLYVFDHPGCKGLIQAAQSPMWLNRAHHKQIYDAEGQFIREEERPRR